MSGPMKPMPPLANRLVKGQSVGQFQAERYDVAASFADPPLRSSRIAICGFGSETLSEAPFDDPDVEVWVLNMLHSGVPRWDRLFELHDRATVENETDEKEEQRKRERGGLPHLDYMRQVTDRPIYVVAPWPDVPCSLRFPVEEVTAALGARCGKLRDTPYFTSTFAFMLAWACLKIVGRRADPLVPEPGEAIHCCGIEMLSGDEYGYQRSNAEMLIGWVLGHGIEVHVPQRSALLESDGMYGFTRPESLELLTHMRGYYEDKKKQSEARRDEALQRKRQADSDWHTHDGASQSLAWVIHHIKYLTRGGKC